MSNEINLYNDMENYKKLIVDLDKDSRRLFELKEDYQVKSDKIIKEAREDNFDFKAVYGANNQSTRQQYADEQLKELIEEKNELEFKIADSKRWIDYYKRIIDMKIQLIKYEG